MTEISASLVKDLREKTGAGMMDCKKALNETKGNLEDAVDWLRKKGLAAAAKKSGRVAAEGLICVNQSADHKSGVVVELNAETDFVARNTQFQDLIINIAQTAITKETTTENLNNEKIGSQTVHEKITEAIAVIGENMNLRRHKKISVHNGAVATYVHSATAPNLGKIGVLVALESNADQNTLLELGKKIAMHVAAASPTALDIASVDKEALEREKNVLTEQAKASNRPDDVIAKMVEGRIRKYYEEVVLLEQCFVMDGKTKIADVIAQKSAEIGQPIVLKDFARFALGEGIEKNTTDFAAEVQAQAGLAK